VIPIDGSVAEETDEGKAQGRIDRDGVAKSISVDLPHSSFVQHPCCVFPSASCEGRGFAEYVEKRNMARGMNATI
jgi:hypothetical protein